MRSRPEKSIKVVEIKPEIMDEKQTPLKEEPRWVGEFNNYYTKNIVPPVQPPGDVVVLDSRIPDLLARVKALEKRVDRMEAGKLPGR